MAPGRQLEVPGEQHRSTCHQGGRSWNLWENFIIMMPECSKFLSNLNICQYLSKYSSYLYLTLFYFTNVSHILLEGVLGFNLNVFIFVQDNKNVFLISKFVFLLLY